MKGVVFIAVILVILGVLFGLVKLKVISVDKYAKKSPILAALLIKAKLYTPPKPVLAPVVVPTPASAKTAAKPILVAPVPAPKPVQVAKATWVPVDYTISQKIVDIYDSMSPDDLASIFARQPDHDVMKALAAMDEDKAGKVLAAMPADRAARLAVNIGRPPDSQITFPPDQTASPLVAPKAPVAPTKPTTPLVVSRPLAPDKPAVAAPSAH